MGYSSNAEYAVDKLRQNTARPVMEADNDLFFKTTSSFKWHYCHPDERLGNKMFRPRTFICGWQFRSYYITHTHTLDFLDENGYRVCEKCRQGYELWIVAE
jgi:hypothetical protein